MSASEDRTGAGAANDPRGEAERRPLRDGIDTARAHLNQAAHSASDAASATLERAGDALASGREKAIGAYAAGREKASEAYQAAFDRAKSAGKSAAEGIDTNPVVALAGGIAIGAVIGALLPRTEREGRLYGALGAQLGTLAKDATGAAREAGQAKLADMGVSQDHGRDLAKTLVDALIQAAMAAGTAALQTAREKRAGGQA